jgi:hypothetical protein
MHVWSTWCQNASKKKLLLSTNTDILLPLCAPIHAHRSRATLGLSGHFELAWATGWLKLSSTMRIACSLEPARLNRRLNWAIWCPTLIGSNTEVPIVFAFMSLKARSWSDAFPLWCLHQIYLASWIILMLSRYLMWKLCKPTYLD